MQATVHFALATARVVAARGAMCQNEVMRRALSFVLLVACGGASAPTAPMMASGEVPARADANAQRPSCALEAHYPFVTKEEQASRIAAFRARNRGEWAFEARDQDGIFGYLHGGHRNDFKFTGDPHADPETVIRAFAERNSELLGFTVAALRAATYKDHQLTASGPLKGYDAYVKAPYVIMNLSFGVTSGEVMSFASYSSTMPLDLSLCPRAPGPPILREVIGRPLIWRQTGVYVQTLPDRPMGQVDAASITKSEPIIYESLTDEGQSYVVAWQVLVQRGDGSWSFAVAASDGRLLHRVD